MGWGGVASPHEPSQFLHLLTLILWKVQPSHIVHLALYALSLPTLSTLALYALSLPTLSTLALYALNPFCRNSYKEAANMGHMEGEQLWATPSPPLP